MADGAIDFDVNVDGNAVTSEVAKLTDQLERAFENARRLRNEFASMGSELTKDDRAIALKIQSLAEMLAKQNALNAPSRNGGVLADDSIRNQMTNNLIMSMNSSIEQVQARLSDAAVKATERMLKNTAEAIQARLTKIDVNAKNEVATFGNADFVQATMNRNRINAQRVVRDFGSYSSLDDKEAAKAAEQSAKYLHDLKTDFFAREQRQQEKDAQTLLNIQLGTAKKLEAEREKSENYLLSVQVNTAKKLEAERMAAEKRQEDLMWAGLRRTSGLMLQQQKEEERQSKTEGASALLAQREKERKEYQSSPEARANAFENRMRIFTDYAAIGLSVYALRNMINTVIDLEDEFKKFQAITQTTDTEVGSFRDQLLKVGEASRYSIRDLTETATVLGQTGLSAEAVVKVLPSITNLATASGSSLKEATDVITAAMGAYNMQASQASDVADTMTAALNRTKLNMTQLAQGISVSANIARDAGISFNELTSVIASLAQAGIKSGSTIGTGTRQLIQELEAPSDKLKTTLSALGISLKDVDIKSQSLIGVLENLREKGFGTSEALRALDLRAAAAFSALTGRLDRVKQLQEAMLLTSASSEGAAKAGESLSATWQRTMNVATELAIKGFAPVIEGLKGFVSITGDALKAMTGLGSTIPVLTTAMVALGASLATQQFASISLGILKLVPANLAAATSITALTSALTFLAANPIVAGGVVAGGIILAALFGTGDTLEKKIDRVTAVINDLQSRQQQTEATITGLDRGIDNLLNKREKLNDDPLLRRVTIIEMQKQFADLGGMVSTGATKIDDLIEAMRRLRGEMAQQLPGNFAAQMDQLQKLIDLKRQAVDTAGNDPIRSVGRVLGTSQFNARGNVEAVLQERLGNNFSSLLDFLETRGEGLDAAKARETGGGFYLNLNRTRTSLLERKDKGENVDVELKAVEALMESLNDKLKKINDLQADNLRLEQLGRDRKVAEVQANPQYQSLTSQRDNLYSQLREGMNDINSKVGISANDKEGMFLQLRTKVVDQLDDVASPLREFEKSLADAGYSKEDIKNALAQLKQDLEGIRKGTAQGLAEAHKALTTINLQREQRSLQAQIAAAVSSLNENSSTADAQIVEERVKAFLERERAIQIALIKAKSDNAEKLTTQELDAIDKINEEYNAKIAQNASTGAERRKKIADREIAFELRVLKSRESKISQDIASLEKELARPSTTAEKAAELRKKIDELIDQAKDIVDKQKGVQIDKDTRSLPRDYTSNGSATGTVASIIEEVKKANQTSLMRYIVGLGNVESTFDVNANRDNEKKAKGLFQFMPGTWDRVGGGDMYSVADQVKNVIKLVMQDMEYFRAKFGREASDNELYTMHQQGRGGGLALMDPANAMKSALEVLKPYYKDEETARKAITGNGGKEDMTAAEFVNVIKKFFDTRASVADKFITSSAGAARARAEDDAARAKTALDDRSKAAKERDLKINFDEQTLKEAANKRATEEAIKNDQRLLKKTTDPNEAERLALSITGSLKGLMEQELRRYKEDPDYRNRSEAQRDADERAIREKYGNRASELALGNSDDIAKKVVGEQQKAVQQLKDKLAEMQRIEGRYDGDLIRRTNQELTAAERKLEVTSHIEGLQRELTTLQQQEAAMEQNGLSSSDGRNRLKERELQIEKELDIYRKRKAVQDAGDRAEGTFGKAFSTGFNNFARQAGMLNAKGEFKSLTEEISGMWQKALGAMSSGLASFFTDIFSGTKKASAAFRDLATSILKSMMQIVSQALANQVLRAIFGGGIFGSSDGGGFFANLFGSSGGGGMAPFAMGGPVRMAVGGSFAASNRDSVHALLNPEEYVIRASAARAIGRENLDTLNSMGSGRVQKATNGARERMAKDRPVDARPVNVWMVSPDQVPPPSASDIIATVATDVQNRGTLRTLIKTVAAGG